MWTTSLLRAGNLHQSRHVGGDYGQHWNGVNVHVNLGTNRRRGRGNLKNRLPWRPSRKRMSTLGAWETGGVMSSVLSSIRLTTNHFLYLSTHQLTHWPKYSSIRVSIRQSTHPIISTFPSILLITHLDTHFLIYPFTSTSIYHLPALSSSHPSIQVVQASI